MHFTQFTRWAGQGLVLLVLCLPVIAQAQADGLVAEIEKALQHRCLDRDQTAISIVELPEGRPIYSLNENLPLLPASVMKLFTTAAALHYLGPEFHFQTDVLYRGERHGEIIRGDLILRGGGDPVLTPEKLWQAATRLREQGIRYVTGRLIADTSFFDDYDRAPSWREERSQRAYDAKIGALSVNFNVVAVHIRPGEQGGDELNAWLEPAPKYIRLINEGRTTRRGGNTVKAWREEANGVPIIKVTGNMRRGSEEQEVYLNILEPARFAAETFRAALEQAGIEIVGPTVKSTTRVNGELLHRHWSPPLTTILKELNTYSNNFIAEQVVKSLAAVKLDQPGTHADGLRLIADFLRTQRVDLRGIRLADGSGLSRKNRFTAGATTDFLKAMLPRFDIGPDFMAVMRVMGARGTFSSRLKDSPARGRIRAKTGSLSGVSNLAGYVSSRDGRLFAYTLFLNNNRCGYGGADRVEDRIVNAIYLLGDEMPLKVAGTAQNSPPFWHNR